MKVSCCGGERGSRAGPGADTYLLFVVGEFTLLALLLDLVAAVVHPDPLVSRVSLARTVFVSSVLLV